MATTCYGYGISLYINYILDNGLENEAMVKKTFDMINERIKEELQKVEKNEHLILSILVDNIKVPDSTGLLFTLKNIHYKTRRN